MGGGLQGANTTTSYSEKTQKAGGRDRVWTYTLIETAYITFRKEVKTFQLK